MSQRKSQSSYLAHGHGGNKLHLCRFFNIDPEKAVDFSASINPLGFPDGLDQYLAECLPWIQNYPDTESREAGEALAGYLQVPAESILPGNGSMELIDLSIRMIRPSSVSVVQPAFSEYERIAGIISARAHSFFCRDAKGFIFSPSRVSKEMKKQMEQSTVLILANPNNPSGALIEGEDLAEIVEFAKKTGKWLIVDEAFIEFAGEEYSLVRQAVQMRRLIVIRSATKFFAIPGLRLGYAVSHPETIKSIQAFQQAWSVHTLAQKAAAFIVKDKEFQKKSRDFIARERDWLSSKLEQTGWLKVHPSRANFLLCEITKDPVLLDAYQIFDRLGKQGIFIRVCANFTGLDSRFFRVAVRTREENIRLISAF